MAAEARVGRGMVRAGRDRALAWAVGAWVVAELAVGAEAPAQVVAADPTCGNPAEAVAVRAAVDWELEASGLGLAVAGRARVVEAAQARAAAEDWEPVASELALAVAGRARAVEAAQALAAVADQEVAEEQAVQGLERAVRDLVAEAVAGRAEEQVLALAKGPHREDGRLHLRCCAGPWLAEQGACQEFLAHQEKAAVFRWQKRMFERCWDCSRNSASPAKIRRRGWTPRPSNPA